MEKENAGKAVKLEPEVILAWINELPLKNNTSEPTSLVLAEWMCAGRIWANKVPDNFKVFCLEQLRQRTETSFNPSDLVLAGLATPLFSEDLSVLEQLSNNHLHLAELLDPDETGLLQWPSTNPNYLPAVQAAWIWSTEQLLKCKLPPSQVEQLIQLKEVYIYETDRQLWNKKKNTYEELPAITVTAASILANNALAMMAWIPDQDRAEDILRAFREQAPPWQDKKEAHEEWLGPAAYLLFEALEAYEMNHAAKELYTYKRNHLSTVPHGSMRKYLYWLMVDG
jgi:hypothetical protein